MTLPASPPITLAQVRAEFGAPAGTPLHAFNRGGAWVPNITQNNGVPTSGAIRLAQLCGAVNYVPISLTAGDVSDEALPPEKGRLNIGTSTAIVSGGSGTITTSCVRVSGGTPQFSVSGRTASFWIQNPFFEPPARGSAIFRWTASDGRSTATKDISVIWAGIGN